MSVVNSNIHYKASRSEPASSQICSATPVFMLNLTDRVARGCGFVRALYDRHRLTSRKGVPRQLLRSRTRPPFFFFLKYPWTGVSWPPSKQPPDITSILPAGLANTRCLISCGSWLPLQAWRDCFKTPDITYRTKFTPPKPLTRALASHPPLQHGESPSFFIMLGNILECFLPRPLCAA